MATLKWTCIHLAQQLLNDDKNNDDDNAIATVMIVDILQTLVFKKELKIRLKKFNNNNVITM